MQNILVEIKRPLPLHSVQKNGWLVKPKDLWKLGNNSTYFRLLAGITNKVSQSENNSIWHVNFSVCSFWLWTTLKLNVSIKHHLQWRVWSWLRMNASGRLNTCKSRGSSLVAIRELATGKRVRNTYATFLQVRNSPGKLGLIPRNIMRWHHFIIIAPALEDGRAPD